MLYLFRLVLLLQSMSKYTEQTLHTNSIGNQSAQHTSSTSIGLIVKKFWCKMVQLGSFIHQIHTEVRKIQYIDLVCLYSVQILF